MFRIFPKLLENLVSW